VLAAGASANPRATSSPIATALSRPSTIRRGVSLARVWCNSSRLRRSIICLPQGIADRSRHAVLGDVTAGDDIDWPGLLSCRYHEPAIVSRGQADGRARRRSAAIATPSSAVKRRITGGSTILVLMIRDRGRNRHRDSHQLIHQPAQATACQASSDEKPRVMRGGLCCAVGNVLTPQSPAPHHPP
jgi:hypothetical protein